MITAQNDSTIQLNGLSTDVKPTEWPAGSGLTIENGSIFIEMDTGTVYLFAKAEDQTAAIKGVWKPFKKASQLTSNKK